MRNRLVFKPNQTHRDAFVKLFRQLTHRHTDWQVWDDLMFMCSAAFSQPLDFKKEREDEYLRRIKLYDEPKIFSEMLGEITLAFEEEGFADILGELYMGFELSSHWKGQFFTPFHVCELMAKVTITDPLEAIKEKGYISVCDPCCGGGALLIAFAKHCKESNVNYQKSVLFIAQDIDPVVARMCYIQMSLLGMPGYVIIGDTILVEAKEIWFTPFYFMNRHLWKFGKSENQAQVIELSTDKNGQYSLFSTEKGEA